MYLPIAIQIFFRKFSVYNFSNNPIIYAGRIIEEKPKEDISNNWWSYRHWRNDYSEYVVPKEENIMVRYVIKFGDGTKEYSRKDLYMDDGNDSHMNGIFTNGNDDDDEDNEDNDDEDMSSDDGEDNDAEKDNSSDNFDE